jgi:cobalt-zinc-cadmium efflux system membrane fusion protein
MMKKKYSIYYILCFFILLQACHKAEKKEEIFHFSLSPVLQKRLKLATAKVENVQGQLLLTGKVSAYEDKMVKVSPLVDGVIQKLNAKLGDYVTKGQTLAVIKSTDVADAENQINDANVTLHNNEKNLNVTKDMLRLGLAAEKDVVLATNEVDRAKGSVRKSEEIASLYQIKNSLYTMEAPISGLVIDKNQALSNQLAYDNAQIGPFYTIADLSIVQVWADVYEADIANVKLGEQVQIQILAYPQRVFKGKIETVQDLIDPQNHTMKVRISIPNEDITLKPEMFAKVMVDFTDNEKMVSVPSDAVLFENSKYYVIVYHAYNNLEVRHVVPYQAANGKTYIQRGVKQGERIMIADQLIVYNALTN